MTLDLIIRNATLRDGHVNIDIAVAGGRIIAIEPHIEADATETIDAEGQLLSPPFVDPHFHMDATLSLGIPRINRSGTLLEGIALWGELKPLLTHEAVVDRALRYCDLAVAQGLLSIRSHVDISDPRLLAVDALLEVRDRIKPYIDLQLVAFPQDGFFRAPGATELLDRALDKGIEIVGGIPHFERTMEAGRQSVEALFRIAADRGLRIDIHCDESDDPLSRHVETMAAETTRYGLGDRVTASHVTSMHSMDNYYAAKLIALIAEVGDEHCRQSAHQHHAAGAAGQLSQAARVDAGAGAARRRRQCRLWPGLHHGSLVPAGLRRYAGGRAYGGACRPDDVARRDAQLLRRR